MSNESPPFDGMRDLFLFRLMWWELLNEYGLDQVFIYVEASPKRGSVLRISDGSGGMLMCGSCIERFDPRSIFNKLARRVECF